LRLVGVGLGKPEHAANICSRIAPSVTCIVDSEKSAYVQYGLRQGTILQLFGPRVLAAGARAASAGHFQSQKTGDPMMMPGTFIVDSQGIIRYAHYSEHAGDHPPIQELLAAGQQLRNQATTLPV
jgi:peroxiredoxin